MAKWIDAEKLEKQAREIVGHSAGHKAWAIINLISIAPAAHVAPRRHGLWINEGVYGEGHSQCSIRCSECYWHYIGYLQEYDYCPHCGAKMDGGGDGEVD